MWHEITRENNFAFNKVLMGKWCNYNWRKMSDLANHVNFRTAEGCIGKIF